MSLPAIVIPCYNRVHSLRRLLESLDRTFNGKDWADVPLVLSVDHSGSREVTDFAASFVWNHGPKEVKLHPRNLGLKENILFCGDLTEKYDSVILLEDDTVVSPAFYSYALSALDRYRNEPGIAQISLYAYEYSEVSAERFHPLYDGHDVYFMQWPCSRGQMWTRKQWCGFREWLKQHPETDPNAHRIPEKCHRWKHSWKKHYAEYLVDRDLFVVYPHHGLATNYGDIGTNVLVESKPEIQSPLSLSYPENLRLPQYSEAQIFYDCFFQPTSYTVNQLLPELAEYEYDVDLQSTKPFVGLRKEYLLSTRPCTHPLKSFDWNLFPFELNLMLEPGGEKIFFGKRKSFKASSTPIHNMQLHFWSKRLMTTRDLLRFFPLRLWITLMVKIKLFLCKLRK